MEEIINIAEIQINYGDAEKKSAELLNSIDSLKKQLAETKKAGGELTTEYVQQTIELKSMQTEYKAHEATLKNVKIAQDATTGSITRMQAENALLRQEQRGLNIETAEGAKRNKEIVATINKNTEAIQANSDKQLKGFQQVGQYKQGFKELGAQLMSSVPGFDAASKGVQGFGIASKVALGVIGVVLVVIGSLVAVFKNFEPVIDKVEQGMAALGAIFTVVKESVIGLFTGAKSLSSLFSGMGDNMSKAAKAAIELKKAQQDLEDLQLQQTVSAARYNKQINELILQSKDRTKTEQERAALIEQALNIEQKAYLEKKKINDAEVKQAKDKIIIGRELSAAELKIINDGNIAAIQDLQNKKGITKAEVEALAAALVKREEIENESISIREKAMNRQNVLLDKAEEAEQKRLEKAQAAREKAEEKRKALEERRKADAEKQAQELAKIAQKEIDDKLLKLQTEVEIYKEKNKSILDGKKELSQKLIEEEMMRLGVQSALQAESTRQQFEAGKMTAEQYALAELQRTNDLEAQKAALMEQLRLQNKALDDERKIQDAENEKILAEGNIFAELKLQQYALDEAYKQELKAAEKTGANTSLIEKKYENAKTNITLAGVNARLDVAKQFAGAIETIAGEGTEAAKIAAAAGVLINTYQAAAAALAPPPIGAGPVLGVALAASAVISGMANIRKIYAVNGKSKSAPSPVAPITSNTIPETSLTTQSQRGTSQDAAIASGVVSRNSNQQSNNMQVAVIIDQVTANQNTQQNIVNSSFL